MATEHWGEMPKTPINSFIPDVTADIERSMDKFCLAEYEDNSDGEKIEKLILTPMNPVMLYSISLHKYANDMTEMIRVAELATEVNLIPSEDAAPPLPIKPKDTLFRPSNTDMEIPELSEAVVKKILTKCVVIMFAHIGFETTHQSVLDILIDVVEMFYQKFCCKFVDELDAEEKGNSSGFPNPLEKILSDTGMGGVKGLNDYYQNRVLKYVDILQKRCKELKHHYATLLIPKCPVPIDKFGEVLRVKVEDGDTSENNPEVHFASFDGETSVLETGYQLLNSLETQEDLQNLVENKDEEMATNSSSIVSLPSQSDISHLPQSTKKKRYK